MWERHLAAIQAAHQTKEEYAMTYARFEEIPAWQEAIRLAEGVYDMTESKGWPGSRSLQDQSARIIGKTAAESPLAETSAVSVTGSVTVV
jgi:hypothetical protein